MTCKGYRGVCNVPKDIRDESEHLGATYCTFHNPILAHLAKPKLTKPQMEWLCRQEELRGMVLPSGTYAFPKAISFLSCHFAGDHLNFHCDGNISFEDVTFGAQSNNRPPIAYIHFSSNTSISFIRTTSYHAIWARSKEKVIPTLSRWTLSESEFFAPVNLREVRFVDHLRLDKSMFRGPIYFAERDLEIPQSIDTRGLRLGDKATAPHAEPSYRSVRVALEKHKNRDPEGQFYAFEMRCQRKGIPDGNPRGWKFKFDVRRVMTFKSPLIVIARPKLRRVFARAVSTSYDAVSVYGQSYGRAFITFFGLQMLFGGVYSYYFDRFGPTLSVDWELIRFTLSQVVKPFETFSKVDPKALGQELGPGLQLLLAAHSVVSLATIALFLLALRWRFRRE